MKLVVFVCLIALSLAAPAPRPDDDDDDNGEDKSIKGVTSIVGTPSVFDTQILSGGPIFQQRAVEYAVPVSINQGAQIFTGAVPYSVGASEIIKIEKIDEDDVDFEQPGYYASAYTPVGVNVAAAPAITAYSTGRAIASPAFTSYKYGQAVASPAVTTYGVSNAVAVAAPAVATQAVVAPIQYKAAVAAPVHYAAAVAAPVHYKAAAVAPAVATIKHEAIVHEVKPVSVAVPSAITYEAAHTVQLPHKEINVPVQHQTVEIPVEQRVIYGTENYVAGSTTQVFKPQITAPAISAPNVFIAKTRHAAPEVTVHQSEFTVEQKSPNYVAAPFDAGIIVEKAAPHINQINVPTPVDVPHPVNVPTPYAVPVAHPVKIKSSVNPVVNLDVHTVKTENVVTPIEYTAHHHVATAPVAAAPAVAVQAAPAVGIAANVVPAAVTYGAAAVSPAAVAVQGVATHGVAAGISNLGVATQGFAPYSVGSQGIFTGGQAVGYAATPVGQNVIYGASPAVISGTFGNVPSTTFAGQNFEQGKVKFVSPGQPGETASHVTAYTGAGLGQIVSGTANFAKSIPASKVFFDIPVKHTA